MKKFKNFRKICNKIPILNEKFLKLEPNFQFVRKNWENECQISNSELKIWAGKVHFSNQNDEKLKKQSNFEF